MPRRPAAAGPRFPSELSGLLLRHCCSDYGGCALDRTFKIATWNVNGVKARIGGILAWLRRSAPDVACFQEIKATDEVFPRSVFEDMGYNVAVHGEKSFNGVAILSKRRFDEVRRGLPGGGEDPQARCVEATLSFPDTALRVASLYLPNGNPVDSGKFSYKLAWMDRLTAHAAALLAEEMPVVLAGDYNVIPEPEDARRPEAWTGDALFRPESRAAFRRLLHLGFTDAVRACHPEPGVYTFWDYQAGAWQKDDGIRIDHLLLSPQAADLLAAAGVDRETRSWEKPSDHAPAWIELSVK